MSEREQSREKALAQLPFHCGMFKRRGWTHCDHMGWEQCRACLDEQRMQTDK